MLAAAAPASTDADPVEAVVGLYLERAEGNPSLALRLAAAEALEVSVELEAVTALVSRGFARWPQLEAGEA